MKSGKLIKAIRYNISICNGALDYVHGFSRPISEVYIPSKKICFNLNVDFLNSSKTSKKDFSLNVFKVDGPRFSEKHNPNIDLDEDFVETLEKFLEDKEVIKGKVKKILEKEKGEVI